jgi:hypothetical protein
MGTLPGALRELDQAGGVKAAGAPVRGGGGDEAVGE